MPPVQRLALLVLLSPFLIGGIAKVLDWPNAKAEVCGLLQLTRPALLDLVTALVIGLQMGASVWLLAGWRAAWLPALALAAFTLAATLLAHRWWLLPLGSQRLQVFNAFWEHIALVGALLFVAITFWRGFGV